MFIQVRPLISSPGTPPGTAHPPGEDDPNASSDLQMTAVDLQSPSENVLEEDFLTILRRAL